MIKIFFNSYQVVQTVIRKTCANKGRASPSSNSALDKAYILADSGPRSTQYHKPKGRPQPQPRTQNAFQSAKMYALPRAPFGLGLVLPLFAQVL